MISRAVLGQGGTATNMGGDGDGQGLAHIGRHSGLHLTEHNGAFVPEDDHELWGLNTHGSTSVNMFCTYSIGLVYAFLAPLPWKVTIYLPIMKRMIHQGAAGSMQCFTDHEFFALG